VIHGAISLFGLVFRSAFRSVLNSDWDQRSAKKWSRFFVWSQRLAKTKLRTERSLNPKLINSPVDFACTTWVNPLEIQFRWTKITSFFAYSQVNKEIRRYQRWRQWWHIWWAEDNRCRQPAPLWHCVTLALFINVLIIIIIIMTWAVMCAARDWWIWTQDWDQSWVVWSVVGLSKRLIQKVKSPIVYFRLVVLVEKVRCKLKQNEVYHLGFSRRITRILHNLTIL